MKRSPLKRSGPIKRKPRRTRARHDPQYLARVHELPCVVRGWGLHSGDLQAAHMTLGRDEKGIGMKTRDRQAVPMCVAHHGQWDRRRGVFACLGDEGRYSEAREWVRRTQEALLGGVH